MTHGDKGRLEIEDHGSVLIVRVDGGPHGLFGLDIANQLEELVDRVDRDPSVHAVVLTGAHPERFVSHADVRWLQEEGAAVPALGRRGAAEAPASSICTLASEHPMRITQLQYLFQLSLRTSENAQKAKFAESPKGEVHAGVKVCIAPPR
jgi:enoyl-CoA hydratase/carnithine racemase